MQRGWNEAHYFNIIGIQEEKNARQRATNRPKTVCKFLTLNWSLLILVRENAPPVFVENYSQKSDDLAFLHIYKFSLFSQLIGRSFGKWTGILRAWFSTCRESLFDYSGAKCFWRGKSNILLWWCYLGRWQSFKICMECRLIMFLTGNSSQ